jgi:hypothetical protein
VWSDAARSAGYATERKSHLAERDGKLQPTYMRWIAHAISRANGIDFHAATRGQMQ